MQNQGSKYKIFNHRPGIDISQIPQGRNVQPFPFHKKLEGQIERGINSPFDSYVASTLAPENNLSYSYIFINVRQVSDFNSELTRRIIKEELAKINSHDMAKIRNEVDVMKTEIRGLKENITKSEEEEKKQSSDELEQRIIDDVHELIEEHREQTKSQLREVIKNMDDTLRKDFHKKYLPVSFVTDVEKMFIDYEDRLDLLEKKQEGTKTPNQAQNPVIIAETFDLRLKKTERESEALRKSIQDINEIFSEIKESVEANKNKLNEESQSLKEKVEDIKKHCSELQKEMRTIEQNINDFKDQNVKIEEKLKSLDSKVTQISRSPLKITHTESHDSNDQVKEFLSTDKNLAVSGVFDSAVKSLEVDEDKTNENLFKSPSKNDSGENISSGEINYQLDSQNHLLDEDGNYILDKNGKEIILTEEQVAILRKSTLVKLNE